MIQSINIKLPLWLSSAQALALLHVRPQTLYANVSRGRIRARADTTDSRRSLYHRDDVRRLAERDHGRRSSETVAHQAIKWGDPVMPSSLSTVTQGRLWYRGQDACALADHASLEDVAALLWGCGVPAFVPAAATAPAARRVTPPGGLERGLLAMAARAATDPPSYRRPQAALHVEAADLMGTLTGAVLGAPGTAQLHQRIAAAWRRTRAADLLRRALVLMAEHELNASTFAARVTASTGAPLACSMLSGLATLAGPMHGGASAAAHTLMRNAMQVGGSAALADWIGQGRRLQMFGHPMYPGGDVRAAALLARLDLPPQLAELRCACEAQTGEPPNIDFAMAALAVSLRLPAESTVAVYAMARGVGWLAHALEQQAEGHLIRPRAHYTGPPPGMVAPGALNTPGTTALAR